MVASVDQYPIVWLKPKEGTINEEILTKGIGTEIFLNLEVCSMQYIFDLCFNTYLKNSRKL